MCIRDRSKVDDLISKIERSTEQSVLNFQNKKEYDQPFVLRFGNIDFPLSEQHGDGMDANPASYTITYKTAEKLARETPKLLNRNENKILNFELQSQLSDRPFDRDTPYKNQLDLKEILSKSDKRAVNHLSIKNVKIDGIETPFDLCIYLIPDEGIEFKWGNRKLNSGDQIKMSGTEFYKNASLNPIPVSYTHLTLPTILLV